MLASFANSRMLLAPSNLAFDADPNGSGQRAAHGLRQTLQHRGIHARLVSLPEGHDPNSFFTQGGDARQFQTLLEEAGP